MVSPVAGDGRAGGTELVGGLDEIGGTVGTGVEVGRAGTEPVGGLVAGWAAVLGGAKGRAGVDAVAGLPGRGTVVAIGGGAVGKVGTAPVMRLLGSGVVVAIGAWLEAGTMPVGGRDERGVGAVGDFGEGARIDLEGGLKAEKGGAAGEVEAGAIGLVGGMEEAGAPMGDGRGGWTKPVAGEEEDAGRSTKRREPVGFLTRTGAGVPSGRVGRPVGEMMPDLAFTPSS